MAETRLEDRENCGRQIGRLETAMLWLAGNVSGPGEGVTAYHSENGAGLIGKSARVAHAYQTV